MQIYHGVIEDIDDPLKLNRVRVRVFGLHTDDTSLIPTSSLPWANVAMPTTSASMSGIGISSTGLLPGSWVGLYFTDPDNQYPIVLFSLHGIPTDLTKQAVAPEELEFTDSEAPREENVVKDSDGNTVTDDSGEPIKTEPPPEDKKEEKPKQSNSKVIPSELGSVSGKYESNGKPGTINNYSDGKDLGGASYGMYQFASYLKGPNTPTRSSVSTSQIKNSPVNQYIKSSKYASQFAGLSPATPEFDAKWKEIGRSDPEGFKQDQHLYIERNYYQVAISKLPSEITRRGKAIHEAVWSMAVQLGPGGCANKFKSTLGKVDDSVCDDKLIEKLYDSRIATVQSDFKSSSGLWAGLTKRFTSEKADLIKLAKTYESGDCSATIREVEEEKVVYKEDQKKETVKEKATVATPSSSKERGFSDPSKKYPLNYNEADTSRLSRGVLTGTVVESKRSGVVNGRDAGGVSLAEPVTQYNAKYPYNRVQVTQSGHIIEYDDTPGYERIHIYHRSGTFIELYPDGQMVTKVRSNNTVVVNANDNSIILGSKNTNIEVDSNTTVNGFMNLIVKGDVFVQVDGRSDITVGGDATVQAEGTIDVTSSTEINAKAPVINLNS